MRPKIFLLLLCGELCFAETRQNAANDYSYSADYYNYIDDGYESDYQWNEWDNDNVQERQSESMRAQGKSLNLTVPGNLKNGITLFTTPQTVLNLLTNIVIGVSKTNSILKKSSSGNISI